MVHIPQGDEIPDVPEPELSEEDANRAMEQQLEAWLAKPRPPVAAPPEPPRELLVSVQCAAAIVGVAPWTIYRWLKQGRLRAKRTATGRLRIDPSSLFQDEPKV